MKKTKTYATLSEFQLAVAAQLRAANAARKDNLGQPWFNIVIVRDGKFWIRCIESAQVIVECFEAERKLGESCQVWAEFERGAVLLDRQAA